MKVDTNHPIWQQIYPGLRTAFYRRSLHTTRAHLEHFLIDQGISLEKDPGDGRWTGIRLPDDDRELLLLVIKYSETDTLK